MDDSEHVDCFSRNAKHAPVISIEQVTVMGSQNFVLRNERAPFRAEGLNLDLFRERGFNLSNSADHASFEIRFKLLEDGRFVVAPALSTVPFVKNQGLRGV